MRIVAGEQQADGVNAGAVEDEGPRVATLGERSRIADHDNLVLEVGDSIVVVDDAVEAGVDARAEREAGGSAMLKERRPLLRC